MKIELNGKKFFFQKNATLATFLLEKQITVDTPGIAVACNGQIAHRASWDQLFLNDGDEIEVIHAVQGG